ncbi:hypothetical protein CLV98_103174 [Dyadobacter jejuensis]|uniref:Acyltransferase 3 domain-containing protein n=1 Tax=Dyadobacter jejuensis TaxID=1082580 RepID=A0A316B894_9BACT|nr:acyltransferase [Dyadobacter jejuensis]PWJ58807.1 hypothetical protein CLV98_103174 [Dyadobacter jejuensis]
MVKKVGKQQIAIVQILRGVAAVFVMFFHYKNELVTDTALRNALDTVFNGGYVGVDLFFVISGFIMVYITQKNEGGRQEAIRFLRKRLIRIVPLYCISTIAYLYLIWQPAMQPDLLKNFARSMLFQPFNATHSPFYGYASLPVGWTLNYEFYFYLLVAVSLLFGRIKWLMFFALFLLLQFALPQGFGVEPFSARYNSRRLLPVFYLLSDPMMWNFLFGIGIGFIFVNKPIKERLLRVFGNGLVLLIILVVFIWKYLTGHKIGHGPLEAGWILALLFLALLLWSSRLSWASRTWITYLGDISFSLYLWHLPVQLLVQKVLYRFEWGHLITHGSILVVNVVLTIVVSHFSYRYIERYTMKWPEIALLKKHKARIPQ